MVSLWLIAGVLALAALFVACSGDDEQQPQQQSQQVEQTAQPSEQSAARSTPQPEQQVQQSAQQSTPQTSEQEESAQQRDETAHEDPLAAEAWAAYSAWLDNLETFEMALDLDLNLGVFAAQIEAMVAARIEPFQVLATIDATSLMAMAEELADDEQAGLDEPLIMQMLISESTAYLTMPQLGGWIDLSEEFADTLGGLSAMLGMDIEELADTNQFGQPFDCLNIVGGSVTEGRYGEHDIWLIDCEIDVEALDAATAQLLSEAGIVLEEAGIESMSMRLGISRATGAPVMMDSHAVLRDEFGLGGDDASDDEPPVFYISAVAELTSWNEPIEFPTPEPLVDGSMFEAAANGGSLPTNGAGGEPPELLSEQELLDLVLTWSAQVDELHVQFIAQALIDGEPHRASTSIRASRSRGIFETSVNVDDSGAFRLLWNRDGIWTSDTEADGEAVWSPSSPALLGFAAQTIDEFLADPDPLILQPLSALLEFAWLSRTIEGDRPPVYELVVEGGVFESGDEHHAHVVELLKNDMAELLAESVVIETVDFYSTTLTINGNSGAVASQVTTAEFETSAGRVELVASVDVVSTGPIEFSQPTK